MKKYIWFIGLQWACFPVVFAQVKNAKDSIPVALLDSVVVNAYVSSAQKAYLPDVQGTYLYTGKKTEKLNLLHTDADMTNKVGRQVFAKIPGVFVYDMDGAGNQINIALRGLDPHRGWEFNIRKDGIITNSDMYGYPASHFNMPLESIERIELVRGTGSLQYGAQFGGMLNYISKTGDSARTIGVETITTVGSYGLLNQYVAAGGRAGKFSYYGYINRKARNGYRTNEHTDAGAESMVLSYQASPRFSLRAEWSRSGYIYRMSGALTDKQFQTDPRQATRTRNYFNPNIHVPSLTADWQLNRQTQLKWSLSAVLGKRNSVLFDKPINIQDTLNLSTLQYNNRQVDIDRFNSYTTELRLMHQYRTGKQTSILVAGVQYMNNDLHRTQLGLGSTGNDFDLKLVTPGWGRDLHFKTKNIALFAENKWQLTSELAVTMGARIESGHTDLSGIINYYPDHQIPVSIHHQFPLYAVTAAYKPSENLQFYGGLSQAYRPMIFKDLVPASLYDKVDPNIRDASGYNAEMGVRGNWRFLKWDITAFLLRDKNRFGTLAQTDNTGTLYLYRTNIGNSTSKGAEIFIQGNWLLGRRTNLTVFTSTSWLDARYTEAMVKQGNANVNIAGNKVESAPALTSRNGATLHYRKFSIALLYSYTAATYADALNTTEPPAATGAVGLVPAYAIWDLSAGFRFSGSLGLKMTINNLTNLSYFTKRPMFYPGPGIWPSEGRNMTATLSIRI